MLMITFANVDANIDINDDIDIHSLPRAATGAEAGEAQRESQGKRLHARSHKSDISLETATEDPLGFPTNPLGK